MVDPAVRVVLVTAPVEAARGLARALVEGRVAACVNLCPVQSVFRWQGQTEEEAEQLLVVKTTAERLPELRTRVLELHPYDCPEFIALEVSDGAPAYLRWVRDEVRDCGE